jgi:uncharacterized protein (TIGR02391 family)
MAEWFKEAERAFMTQSSLIYCCQSRCARPRLTSVGCLAVPAVYDRGVEGNMGKRRKAVRRVTADKRERLHRLARLLYSFLPLSSYSEDAVTFKTILAESHVSSYLPERRGIPKQKALEDAVERVYRYHERLPWILIRKIVPAAINHRRYKRNPLTRAELDELSEILYSLGIDMRQELASVVLDEALPRTTVPPKELEARLRQHDLHPKISEKPVQLFSDGHYNEAVRKASEILEDHVRDLAGTQRFGKDLMGNAFGSGNWLRTDLVEPENQQNFVDGYKHLAMGAMVAIRNIFSHGNEEQRTPEECFEMLLFLNWLFRWLKDPQ